MKNQPWKRSHFRRIVRQWMTAAAVVAISCLMGDVHAQIFVDYTWNNPSGGSYHTISNWTPSSGFGGIPDSDNEGAVFNLPGQYAVFLTSDISTNSALVRDGTMLLALGTAANPRSYTLNSLTVDPAAGGGEPRLAVFDGTLRATTIHVAAGGQFDLDSDVLNFDNGSAAVTGEGSRLSQHTGFLRVGESGTGTLLVEEGGTVENADGAAIGRFAGSDGTATVTGNNSTLDVDANLTIGQEGMGTLLAQDGGDVESVLGRIAFSSSGVGSATITGAGSIWTMSDELRVGESGEGTLLIENGGCVLNVHGFIGFNDGSTGSVSLTGTGSTWTSDGLLGIGEFGEGNLVISDGGSVSSQEGRLGFGSEFFFGNGTVTVTGTGSTWTSSSMLDVGSIGVGELVISDGGVVSNTMGRIARESGSTGKVTVTGGGSTWTNNSELRVGNRGRGELTIADGGSVANTIGLIGRQVGSTGTVTVTGGNSAWVNSDDLLVGESGAGTLMISNGASVSNIVGRIGLNSESTCTVTVTGIGSKWSSSFIVSVGDFGSGELNIEDGGSVTSGSSSIAAGLDATGTVTITGIDSSWAIDGLLTVGLNGEASMSIQNGGNLFSNGGRIGLGSNAVGGVTLFGGNSTWMNHGGLSIGGSLALGYGGEGALNIHSGSTVSVADETVLFPDGNLRLFGGTLATTGITFDGGGEFEWLSGTLHVDVYNGNLVNQGGTLAPGQSAGGTTIFGDYTQQSGATLQIEIGGTATATQYDFVDINGDALVGGSLELALINDFVPSPDDEFIVFNADDLSGFFTNAGNGQRVDTTDGLGSFVVRYGPGNPDPNQIVLTNFELAGLPADFDLDGDVDGDDLAVWQGAYGMNTLADADGDGDSDGRDFLEWQRQFGSVPLVAVESLNVPEPIGACLFSPAVASILLGRRRLWQAHRRGLNAA